MRKVLQNFESIAILIAKFQKHYNAYCKISKTLQYLLQKSQSITLSIAKSQSISIPCNAIGTIPGWVILVNVFTKLLDL